MKIQQIRYSKPMRHFKDKFSKKFNLKEYTNKNKPVIFYGIYKKDDLNALLNHKDHITIFWRGSDAEWLWKVEKWAKPVLRVIRSLDIRHLAVSEQVQESLNKVNIKSILVPATPTIIEDKYKPIKGDNVYFYGTKKHG